MSSGCAGCGCTPCKCGQIKEPWFVTEGGSNSFTTKMEEGEAWSSSPASATAANPEGEASPPAAQYELCDCGKKKICDCK